MRDDNRAGLSWFAIEAADAEAFDRLENRLQQAGATVTRTPDGIETADPWGTRVRVTRA
jgi:catechol 2,3-dioxygenase